MAQKPARFGERIRIKDNCELGFCRNKIGRVAYIGNGGISVYLEDDVFDDCIPLNEDEWEPVDNE